MAKRTPYTSRTITKTRNITSCPRMKTDTFRLLSMNHQKKHMTWLLIWQVLGNNLRQKTQKWKHLKQMAFSSLNLPDLKEYLKAQRPWARVEGSANTLLSSTLLEEKNGEVLHLFVVEGRWNPLLCWKRMRT